MGYLIRKVSIDADFTVWAQDLHLRAGALTEYVLEHRSAICPVLPQWGQVGRTTRGDSSIAGWALLGSRRGGIFCGGIFCGGIFCRGY